MAGLNGVMDALRKIAVMTGREAYDAPSIARAALDVHATKQPPRAVELAQDFDRLSKRVSTILHRRAKEQP